LAQAALVQVSCLKLRSGTVASWFASSHSGSPMEKHEQEQEQEQDTRPLRRDLFLIDAKGFVFTLSPAEENIWFFSRLPPGLLKQLKHVLLWWGDSWRIVDFSPGTKPYVLHSPAHGVEQTRSRPPLGSWLAMTGEQLTLLDCVPAQPPLEFPIIIERAFASVNAFEEGGLVWLTVTIKSEPISDDLFEPFFSELTLLMESLAQRPETVVFLKFSLQHAAIPALRHVKRFVKWATDTGLALVLVTRAMAIVLNPQGLAGRMLMGVVKMVLTCAPSPWANCILPTDESAAQWFAEQAAALEAQTRSSPAAAQADALLTRSETPPVREQLERPAPDVVCAEPPVASTSKAKEEVSDTTIVGQKRSGEVHGGRRWGLRRFALALVLAFALVLSRRLVPRLALALARAVRQRQQLASVSRLK